MKSKKAAIFSIFLILFIYSDSANIFSEVVPADPTQPNGVTDEQWRKYKDTCTKEINEKYKTYPGKLPQSFLDHEFPKCIQSKVGIKWKCKDCRGWAKERPQTRNGRPYVDPWNPRNPRAFNVYQYCLGRSKTSCDKNCDHLAGTNHKSREHCLSRQYQCEERLRKCICNYKYHVRTVEVCYPHYYWEYQKGKEYQWLYPTSIMGKGSRSVECAGPIAPFLDACSKCAAYIRCTKVCDLDQSKLPESITIGKKVKRTRAQCRAYCYKHLRKKYVNVYPYRYGTPRECPAVFFK